MLYKNSIVYIWSEISNTIGMWDVQFDPVIVGLKLIGLNCVWAKALDLFKSELDVIVIIQGL